MVHVKVHPPQQDHSREINESPKGAQAWEFDFGWGRAMWACGGRRWQHQCILSSTETSMMLIYLPHAVTFMWWRRFPRRVYLILHNFWLARGLSCNQFMARRQRIKLAGMMKKVTCRFSHKERIRISWKTILQLFVTLQLKLTTEMILHQRTSLHSNKKIKGSNSKVRRCGNQRALFALERPTMSIIISCVFGNTHKKRCWIWAI